MSTGGITAIAGLIAAVFGGLGYLTQLRGPSRRDEINADLAIWRQLPSESAAAAVLLAYIDDRIRVLASVEASKRRHPAGVITGLSFAAAAGVGTVFLWQEGHVVLRMAGIVVGLAAALMLIYGLDSVPRVERNEQGNRIRKAKPAAPSSNA